MGIHRYGITLNDQGSVNGFEFYVSRQISLSWMVTQTYIHVQNLMCIDNIK